MMAVWSDVHGGPPCLGWVRREVLIPSIPASGLSGHWHNVFWFIVVIFVIMGWGLVLRDGGYYGSSMRFGCHPAMVAVICWRLLL
jgi:hypothetical protein